MKNLKFTFLSMLITLFLVTACTNNEPVTEDQQQTEESQSISIALNQLSNQFDLNGNVSQTNNPAGNIVLDFCFDFVYPLTLSFNNDATVEVTDLNGLIDIIIASTEDLYINGIAFPFDVETFNDDSNTIEVVTINNEEEFIDLIEDCDFGDFETCECFEIYEPVCVEITDPNGNAFTVTYPNACYAECDGFDEDNFLEDCANDYNPGGGFDCFEFVFPLDIIINNGTIISINSLEELGNVSYDIYNFDFVYPFNVALSNGTLLTINGPEDIEGLLGDCYDDDGGDDDCEECENAPIDPICIEYTTLNGETEIIPFPNLCYAECAGFSEDDIVDCDDDNNPGDACSMNNSDNIAYVFAQCQTWEAIVGNEVFDYLFNTDGTLEIYNQNSDLITSGTWEITVDDGSNSVVMIIETISPNFTTVWFFINCDEEGGFEIITNGGVASEISAACD